MLFVPQLAAAPAGRDRRGVILMVVIALLALFATVGLTVVFYAEAEAAASRAFRQAGSQTGVDVDPEQLLYYFLGQMIYDDDDPALNNLARNSALRGHSLGRSMYGYNPNILNLPYSQNVNPFNGTGRLHYNIQVGPGQFLDNYNMVCYQVSDDPKLKINWPGGLLRHPERLYMPGDPRDGQFLGGHNVNWTYPDMDNFFLGAMTAKGEILIQSFHRPWTGVNFNDPSPYQRYLTLRPQGGTDPLTGQLKYPGVYHPNFPLPENGGDVKCVDGTLGVRIPGTNPPQYYNNDSYWMDLGFPVMTAANGRRYKPLFAAFIMDLDSRLNANAAGNIRGRFNNQVVSMSNHGYGPWEINPSKVLTGLPQGNDWYQLFAGNGLLHGRYGPDANPARTGSFLPGGFAKGLPFWAQVDLDGVYGNNINPNDPINYSPSRKWVLPGEDPTANPLSPFPYFPPNTYGSGDQFERTNHPRLFNIFNPNYPIAGLGASDDRLFAASNMEALLRYGGTGSPALTSDLFRLAPLNFIDPVKRRQVTTHSFDVVRPGLTPWLSDAAAVNYRLQANDPYPQAGRLIRFPVPQKLPGTGEFAADGRAFSTAAFALERIKLNCGLPDYPDPDPITGLIDPANVAAFQTAQKARQDLAKAFFDRLRAVTTGARPTDPIPNKLTQAMEYDALRWLAQLAANMVDYCDVDDYSTPFNFDLNAPGGDWVFGTELPRLVLNEIYAELQNDPADPGPKIPVDPKDLTKGPKAMLPFQVNFWVELFNPMKADPQLTEGGVARLQQDTGDPTTSYPIYKVTIVPKPAGQGAPIFKDPVLGIPELPKDPSLYLEVANYAPAPGFNPIKGVDVKKVLPTDGRYIAPPGENKGFYVLGPKNPFEGTAPPINPATLQVKEQTINNVKSAMTLTLPVTTLPVKQLLQYNLFLRRLACPHRPHNDTPGPNYNPYITVDYVEDLPVMDAAVFDNKGKNKSFRTFLFRLSMGRKQPYAAHRSQQSLQIPDTDPNKIGIQSYTDQPQHTFFRHNGIESVNPTDSVTLKQPFDFVGHLNRPLVSPMELLHVAKGRPHELTQNFMTGFNANNVNQRFQHTALPAFLDETSHLYRFFEFLDANHRTQGESCDGRVAGRINLNTLWDTDLPIFQALCDHNLTSSYDPAAVAIIYSNMLASRTRGAGGTISQNDRPFKSLATGRDTPAGLPNEGIADTLLRPQGNVPLFFVTPQNTALDHPMLKTELLSKIFNNVTTRSNVFAVWMTVGFFEVEDESVVPPRLGKEVGRADGRHVRHRFFAIIDRSDLRIRLATPGGVEIPPSNFALGQMKSGQGYTVDLTPLMQKFFGNVPTLTFNLANDPSKTWSIVPGTVLILAPGTADEEAVVVNTVVGKQFTIVPARDHPANTPFIIRGNPGPWRNYDPRRDNVVLHYSVIK